MAKTTKTTLTATVNRATAKAVYLNLTIDGENMNLWFQNRSVNDNGDGTWTITDNALDKAVAERKVHTNLIAKFNNALDKVVAERKAWKHTQESIDNTTAIVPAGQWGERSSTMLYLYSKDNYGFEFCERFESESDLQKYCFLNLPKNDEYMIASVVYPGDNDAWEADEDSSPNMKAIAACVEAADRDGMQRPFWLICEGDCDYTAIQDEKDVDWWELFLEWLDYGAYEVTPRQYMSGEITPDQADQQELYALAEAIREDLGISDESDE